MKRKLFISKLSLRRMTTRGAAALIVFAAVSLQAQVTFDRILHADREPQNWLTYSGNLQGHRHTGLAQITPTNVKDLQLAWIWQERQYAWTRRESDPGSAEGKFEATPLVVDGQLFTVQAPNDLI